MLYSERILTWIWRKGNWSSCIYCLNSICILSMYWYKYIFSYSKSWVFLNATMSYTHIFISFKILCLRNDCHQMHASVCRHPPWKIKYISNIRICTFFSFHYYKALLFNSNYRVYLTINRFSPERYFKLPARLKVIHLYIYIYIRAICLDFVSN